MKNILIINGHPNPESFNSALADAYKKGAEKSGFKVNIINLHELDFNPNLKYGYYKRTELEPDLLNAWEQIRQAEHLVWIHPVWWGGFPAIMKGFIDRVFLPNFAFRYKENSVWQEKLLIGKTARIITTLDQPAWYYRFINKAPSVHQLKKNILQFCGVHPVKVSYLVFVKKSSITQREKWLLKIEKLGKKGK